jgi:hypothetical protein
MKKQNNILDKNIIDELDDDSNVSGSDNELQIHEDKVGNADTEDEEVDTEEVKMSAYETMRLMNIKRNEEYLKSLGIEDNSLMLMKEKVKIPRVKKVTFKGLDTDKRQSSRLKEKSVDKRKKTTGKIIMIQKEAVIDSPLKIKEKADAVIVEFDVITIHTFNKFVEEISDEDKETKLMQLNNSEERVSVKKRFYKFIRDSNEEHYRNLTFKEIDESFSLISTFTTKSLIVHIRELVKCLDGGEFPKVLVLYYLLMFLELKTFANYLRSICFRKKFYI